MKNLAYLGLLIIALSCKQEVPTTFLMTGSVKGVEDGVMLYLDNAVTNTVIDSAQVKNNVFNFGKQQFAEPTRVVLHTKDFSNYAMIWVENNPMNFEASEGDFRSATITGSETEKLNSELKNLTINLGHDAESDAKRKDLEVDFVRKNPSSIVSANILSIYDTSWGKELTQELFETLSDDIKASTYGVNISEYLRLNKSPKIGQQFADFSMLSTKGIKKSLSEFKGKVVMLEFWASWCGPCRQENPNLVKTYSSFKDKGFEIMAVSLDINKEAWLKAIEKDGLDWTHVSDLKGNENEAGLIYGVSGIPDNFLIDKHGIIVARNLRGQDLDEALAELID